VSWESTGREKANGMPIEVGRTLCRVLGRGASWPDLTVKEFAQLLYLEPMAKVGVEVRSL
jgi:hypothetical protein